VVLEELLAATLGGFLPATNRVGQDRYLACIGLLDASLISRKLR
jgi:hypothetical protein